MARTGGCADGWKHGHRPRHDHLRQGVPDRAKILLHGERSDGPTKLPVSVQQIPMQPGCGPGHAAMEPDGVRVHCAKERRRDHPRLTFPLSEMVAASTATFAPPDTLTWLDPEISTLPEEATETLLSPVIDTCDFADTVA